MNQVNTEKELLEKLELLGIEDEEKKKSITCSLIGHSRIQTHFWGYYNCARCGVQLGDGLGAFYPDAKKVVVVGHKCPICEANYKELTWKDKIFCLDPL